MAIIVLIALIAAAYIILGTLAESDALLERIAEELFPIVAEPPSTAIPGSEGVAEGAELGVVTAMAPTPRGIVLGGPAGQVVLHDPDTGGYRLVTETAGGSVNAMLWSGAELWIGTTRGLRVYRADGTQVRDATEQLPHRNVLSLAEVETGGAKTVAAGTQRGTVFFPSPASSKLIVDAAGQARVYDIARWDGRVLFATENGLLKWDPDEGVERLLPGTWVSALATGEDGVWAGTSSGVYRLDQNGIEPAEAGRRAVQAGALDANGGWVVAGTAAGLLVRTPQGAWKRETKHLPSANVLSILVHEGVLYAGTGKGLVAIPLDGLR